jgi:hypothetical protein
MRTGLLQFGSALVLAPLTAFVGGAGWDAVRVVLAIEVGGAAFVLLVAGLTRIVVEAER